MGWIWAIFHSAYILYTVYETDNSPFFFHLRNAFGYGSQAESPVVVQSRIDLESNNSAQREFIQQPIVFNYGQGGQYQAYPELSHQVPAISVVRESLVNQSNEYQAPLVSTTTPDFVPYKK